MKKPTENKKTFNREVNEYKGKRHKTTWITDLNNYKKNSKKMITW